MMSFSLGSHKISVVFLLEMLIVLFILFGTTLFGCMRVSWQEGLQMMKEGLANNNSAMMGPEFGKAKAPGYILNPDKWSMPTLNYSPGTTPDAGVTAILDRPKQPIPLPSGELDMFASTEFKPECCPNAYSSSTGCACMTVDQYDYLKSRGSNNVPYSEY